MNIANFIPPLGLSNPHLQTLWPRAVLPKRPWSGDWQMFELADGDFVDLCWRERPEKGSQRPLLVIFHGLEGSVDSPYVWQTMEQAHALGWTTVVMHFRGCGINGINRLPRAYHSGDTTDATEFLTWLQQTYPDAPLYLAGFSLGGNMLAQLLTTAAGKAAKAAAIACAPLDLHSCSERIDQGFSRFYRRYLLTPLKQKFEQKREQGILDEQHPLATLDVKPMRSFFEFDDKVTAPLHGFTGVDDYYQRASGKQFLADISVPTLIIHANDDPFMGAAVVPEKTQLSSAIRYELSPHGGHMGFIQRRSKQWHSWLPERLLKHLASYQSNAQCYDDHKGAG